MMIRNWFTICVSSLVTNMPPRVELDKFDMIDTAKITLPAADLHRRNRTGAAGEVFASVIEHLFGPNESNADIRNVFSIHRLNGFRTQGLKESRAQRLRRTGAGGAYPNLRSMIVASDKHSVDEYLEEGVAFSAHRAQVQAADPDVLSEGDRIDPTDARLINRGGHITGKFSKWPLAVVLAFGDKMPPERVSALDDIYSPHFEEVVFLVSGTYSLPYDAPIRQKSRLRECYEQRHVCVSRFLLEIQQRDSAILGSLVTHLDFWFRPDILRDFDDIWMTEPGLNTSPRLNSSLTKSQNGDVCLHNWTSFSQELSWDGWDGWGDTEQTALQHKQRFWAWSVRLAELAHVEPIICAWWSDLYFLPRRGWKSFVSLSNESREVHHEVAIPTILAILEKRVSSPIRIRKIKCEGSCMGNGVPSDDPESFSKHMCGHRLDLKNAKLVEAYSAFWTA